MPPFRLKPWYIGIFTAGRWVTTYPWINVPKDVDPYYYSWITAHETVHLVQQKDMGLYKWLWKYFTNRAFRLDQEAAGAAAEYWALIKATRIPSQDWVNRYAQEYANSSYFWCAKSVEEGEAVLNQKIKDIAPAPIMAVCHKISVPEVKAVKKPRKNKVSKG